MLSTTEMGGDSRKKTSPRSSRNYSSDKLFEPDCIEPAPSDVNQAQTRMVAWILLAEITGRVPRETCPAI